MKLHAKTKKSSAAKRAAVRPALVLEADAALARAGKAIAVRVAFEALDRVDLRLEPAGTFSLDLASLSRAGVVRLRAEKDGKATLVASGRVGEREAIRRLLHVECEGPVLRLVGFGYWPKSE